MEVDHYNASDNRTYQNRKSNPLVQLESLHGYLAVSVPHGVY